MDENHRIFVTHDESRSKKDERQRHVYYADWLTATNRPWYLPDLDSYRDYLLNERHLKPSSVAAHISAIRTRYHDLLKDAQVRLELERAFPADAERGIFIAAMEKTTEKKTGHVEFDRNIQIDYLTPRQVDALLAKPDMTTRQGLRDVSAIGLMYCTGMSETELCALQISDLNQQKNGQSAIHVPKTPGGPDRFVVIYDDELFDGRWLLTYIQAMIESTYTTEGRIFLGYFRGGKALNGQFLTPRGVQKMLKGYPVEDANGTPATITALNLRRTFARNLYKLGVSIGDIHANLGHRIQRTTYEYIGLPSADEGDLVGQAGPILERLYEHWRHL